MDTSFLRDTSAQIEKTLDTYGQPVKPYLPALSRFLVVATFYEDSLRILFQWSDQRYFLERTRGFPWGISHIFLLLNVFAMLSFSSTLIAKKHVSLSVSVLAGVIVCQALGYGLVFDLVSSITLVKRDIHVVCVCVGFLFEKPFYFGGFTCMSLRITHA